MTRTRRPWGRAGGGQAGLKERPGSRSVERDVCDTVPVLLMANAAAARGIENIMATYGTAQQLPPLGLHRLQKEQQTSLPKIPTFKGQTEIGRRVGGKGGEGKGGHGAAGSAFLLPISQMECISSLHPTISQEIVTFHKFCTTLSDVYSKKH